MYVKQNMPCLEHCLKKLSKGLESFMVSVSCIRAAACFMRNSPCMPIPYDIVVILHCVYNVYENLEKICIATPNLGNTTPWTIVVGRWTNTLDVVIDYRHTCTILHVHIIHLCNTSRNRTCGGYICYALIHKHIDHHTCKCSFRAILLTWHSLGLHLQASSYGNLSLHA